MAAGEVRLQDIDSGCGDTIESVLSKRFVVLVSVKSVV